MGSLVAAQQAANRSVEQESSINYTQASIKVVDCQEAELGAQDDDQEATEQAPALVAPGTGVGEPPSQAWEHGQDQQSVPERKLRLASLGGPYRDESPGHTGSSTASKRKASRPTHPAAIFTNPAERLLDAKSNTSTAVGMEDRT